jgi:hypothetical protein
MRRIIMTGAAAVFTATALAASATEAVAPAPAVRSAQVNVVHDVPYVCGWWGRQCWTIGYAYYYRPYYVYSAYPPYGPYRPNAYYRP